MQFTKSHVCATGRTLRQLALATVAVVMLSACGSSTKVALGDRTSKRAMQEQYGAAIQNAFTYRCLQSKLKLSVGGKTLPARLNAEQGKNFRLIVNAPLVGFELGRVEVDRDSMTLVDKWDKLYTVAAIDDVKFLSDEGINVEALQCLFLGRIYVPGRGEAHVGDYRRLEWTSNDDGTITGAYQGKDYTLTYTLDGDGCLRRTEVSVPSRDIRVDWDYTAFTRLQTGVCPSEESIEARVGSTFKAGVTLASPNVNAGKWDPFDPEDKYQRVSPRELLDKLKSLVK